MRQLSESPALRTPLGRALMAAIVLSGSCAFTTYAKDAREAEAIRSNWGIGAGVVALEKPYRDFDTETLTMPVISYENRWISASVPTFDVKLYSGAALSLRLRARYAGDGYEADDSPTLSGMDERKASLWAGGAIVLKTRFANVTGEYLADAMSESKGARARIQVDRRFAAGRFGVTPRVAVERVDAKYVNYYYGVRLSEVTATRPFHEGEAATNVHAGVRVDYTPALHHMLFLDLGAIRFGSPVEASPLVDKPNQTSLGLGYVYRF